MDKNYYYLFDRNIVAFDFDRWWEDSIDPLIQQASRHRLMLYSGRTNDSSCYYNINGEHFIINSFRSIYKGDFDGARIVDFNDYGVTIQSENRMDIKIVNELMTGTIIIKIYNIVYKNLEIYYLTAYLSYIEEGLCNIVLSNIDREIKI